MAPQPGINGVLPASVLQKNATNTSTPRGPRAAQPRLKLVLRRLPPGLTKTEFEKILGDEWKVGAGKVDWFEYINGKVSKDPAKPSRPARAYIRVVASPLVLALNEVVRQSSFNDAARSSQDSALIGPPALEYAPYNRVPGNRRKHDSRQGTIDQDQEFKDFLESLTNPITKPAVPEGDTQKENKVTTTPLIEALREKKANKEKPQAKGKHGRGEPKDDGDKADKKILSKSSKETPSSTTEKGRKAAKADKAAKEAVKVLKEAAASKDAAAEKAAPAQTPERKRGNASIAKSIVSRDLGLAPGPARRRGGKAEATATTAAPATTTPNESMPADKQKAGKVPAVPPPVSSPEKAIAASPKKNSRAERRAGKGNVGEKPNKTANGDSKQQTKTAPAPAPTILKKPQTPTTPAPPKGPAAARSPPTEPAASRSTPSQPQNKGEAAPTPRPQAPAKTPATTAAPAPTGRQAFLKHANPSQGITEALIEEAFKAFGAIEKVEIDKRKGFAYVDFVEPQGLQKAIAASPVKVAQGAVQVLERKDRVVRNNRPHPVPHLPPPPGPARGRGGFSGRGRGRGGARGSAHGPVEGAPSPAAHASTPAAPSTGTT
ncbi:uncharacterized protein EI97DRAFT_419138 [Westerdykella ornata]|uniref:RRM domain-containing protein n=1 Tax=Westerdykella ornata TaxID=318751 RepID=A0A6A6JMS0_WESOR|nr:uncharacterized protein EI97DRAFT_419138 [Westerdykella ornata]KAF2276229.1 hypothetical protein EI97DRAFT_419138 [Westerdykella ornata]